MRLPLISLLVVAVLAGASERALAAFSSEARAQSSISSLQVRPVTDATSSSADGCASVTVAWSRPAGADSYRIEVSENGAPFVELYAQTADVTSVVDSTGHPVGATVTYRVLARHASSAWTASSASETAPLVC